MQRSQIEYVDTNKLRPHPKNVRTHPNKQIDRIEKSIQSVGFTSPIIVDENYVVLAGHARLKAAERLGQPLVPVIVTTGLSEAKKRAYLLADNKLAEQAGYDRAALASEIVELGPLLAEANLDFEVTGLDPAEVDSLLHDHADPEHDPADNVPPLETKAVTKLGDVWILGEHRLMCGNACSGADVARLMKRERAAMVITDPPYNRRMRDIQGRGRTKHRNFVQASGDMSETQFVQFLSSGFSQAARHSIPGSIHFVFMDWRHIGETLTAGRQVYSELKNLIVWVKTNAGQGSFYRSQHELIFAFKNGEAPHINNFGLVRHRSNVWNCAGANSFKSGRLGELALHPTVKPIALVADAMRDCSRRGDVVLDLFLGSGTTILAAERIGRHAYGLELDPLYADVGVRRWQAYTKKDAILAGTKRTFDDIAGARRSAAGARR